MFNLLPEKYKKRLENEYNIRLAIVVFVLIFLITLISVAFLTPSYLLSKTKETEVENRLATIKNQAPDQTSVELNAVLLQTKKELSVLAPTSNISFLESIKKILARKIPNITIIGLTIIENGSIWKTSISGVASNRDTLISFKKSLESEQSFSGVDLPISDLARNKDIPFTITVSGALKNNEK
ncbi:MAG: hypothetical protein NUV47_01770 [Patescibacteria group bacterium]|nr:hypothetical protein [Patescibacteria group bacterium]